MNPKKKKLFVGGFIAGILLIGVIYMNFIRAEAPVVVPPEVAATAIQAAEEAKPNVVNDPPKTLREPARRKE